MWGRVGLMVLAAMVQGEGAAHAGGAAHSAALSTAAQPAPPAGQRVAHVLSALKSAGAAERARVLGWMAEVRLRPANALQLDALNESPTDPRAFPIRLSMLRGCLARYAGGRAIVDHLMLEYHVNAVQASRRLDRCAAALWKGVQPDVEAVRASLPKLPARGDTSLLYILSSTRELVTQGRENLSRLDPAWESELDAAVDSFKKREASDREGDQPLIGEALLLRDRDAQDPGLAHGLLGGAHATNGSPLGRGMAALGAGLCGRVDAQRRLLDAACANGAPPLVHLWAAVSASADPAPGGADRFLAHLAILSTSGYDRAIYGSLLRVAPCLSVMERGTDIAMAMLAQGDAPCPPALVSGWTAAIELDPAPLAALALAVRAALPRERANALLSSTHMLTQTVASR